MIIKLQHFVESRAFQNFIIAVIVVNAITLGLETWPTAMAHAGSLLLALDQIALAIFVVEIVLKLVVYRASFFRSGWNVFDFTIVAITVAPVDEGLAVLRSLRILRALRLISVLPSMRKVVSALLRALPGMGSVVSLLLLLFYIASVMATKLFAADFPDWFGSIGASLYTLFQIMTLESWSMGIVRPVMEAHPFAWIFFITFILLTTFAVLNLFIAIMVDAMSATEHVEQEETRTLVVEEHQAVMSELQAIRAELAVLRAAQFPAQNSSHTT
ncbi:MULTISPECIES: ion transporter [Pseudomonadota]|uniref:Voltage-gated sodium channel n=2 Tax=Pseudomonadota TaxID=1224 RepID=A0A1I4ND10_9GAMM|nr:MULTISPECIES: ion transporter [Pseudomonadota]APR03160.1 voltage-gated sodium channel subunit [Thauera chlorobenzoica]SEF98048.1 voltage-gated sodium channel [Thauera chlorobenzoica]SFM13266.1 voltage-gated sodium channel [Halopseudomonas yangmingensis]